MSVFVATLHSGELTSSYTDSVLRAGLKPTLFPANPNTISQRRNEAAAACLESDADHLLFVDSDMGFAPDAVELLLEADQPVIGALCFGLQQREPDGMGGHDMKPFPTIFDYNGSTFDIRWNYERDAVTKCDATGCAFLLIHRDVLLKFPEGTWFDRATLGSELLGEDISFCARAGELGIPVHVHTGVPTNHYKSLWVSESTYVGARAVSALVERKLRGA